MSGVFCEGAQRVEALFFFCHGRFGLRDAGSMRIATPMRLFQLGILLGMVGLVSCGERREVKSNDTRELSMRDEDLGVDVPADERFGSPPQGGQTTTSQGRSSGVVATTVPDDWVEQAGTSFRLLNYRFGESGEVYVSLSRGGLLMNVNRWLSQFGSDELDETGLARLEEAEVAGHRGVWVMADGDFRGGMGAEPQSDWALRGVVAEGPQGILTVKLLGPVDEVREQESSLREFVAGLKFQE